MRKVKPGWVVMARLLMQLGKPHDDCLALLKYLDESEQRARRAADAIH